MKLRTKILINKSKNLISTAADENQCWWQISVLITPNLLSPAYASPMSYNFSNHENNYHLLSTESVSSTSLSSLHINSFNPMNPIRKVLLTPLYRWWNWGTVVSPLPKLFVGQSGSTIKWLSWNSNPSSLSSERTSQSLIRNLLCAIAWQRPRWFPKLNTFKLHSSSFDLLVLTTKFTNGKNLEVIPLVPSFFVLFPLSRHHERLSILF